MSTNSILGVLAQSREDRVGDIEETSRGAGADIEQPGHLGMVEQEQHHGDGIVHMDEIASLSAVGASPGDRI